MNGKPIGDLGSAPPASATAALSIDAGEGAKMGAGGKRSEGREGERGRKAQQRAIHSTRDD